MSRVTRPTRTGIGFRSVLAVFLLVLLASTALAQQAYVGRYDFYAGYAYFDSPKISLQENGFHIQAGIKPKTWYVLGFDYSNVTGSATLTPDLLLPSLQQSLGQMLALLAAAGKLPPGYTVVVPTDSSTQTITGGPELTYRRISWLTPFVRPSIGLIREVATPKASDPITSAIIQQLAPSGSKTDWAWFYGAGGGFDVKLTKNVAIRAQADFVWDHLFADILQYGRHTVRFSIGPAFQFGKNIAR